MEGMAAMTVCVHCPPVEAHQVVMTHCPDCERLTAALVRGYAWYAPLVTCLACGCQWSEGERLRTGRLRERIRRAADAIAWWMAQQAPAGDG